MPQITLVISRLAQSDLTRIYNFLNDLSATKQANSVMKLLKDSFIETLNKPSNGKEYTLSVDGEILENIREISVRFGKSGYSYLFWYDTENTRLVILAAKHFREETYRLDLLTLN